MSCSTISKTFVYHDSKENSKTVKLSGSFNDWNPIEMTKENGSDVWKVSVDGIKSGTCHEYKYLVDDQDWIHDPDSPVVKNKHGTFNNVYKAPSRCPSSGSVVSSDGNVEVERKFLVPPNYEELLTRAGFGPLKGGLDTEILKDTYFDTGDYNLMKEDFWLRLRNGDWELKYPVDTHPDGNTLYHETSNQEDILIKIKPLVVLDENKINNNLGDLVINNILHQFACIDSKRQCFQDVDKSINIVVDSTDWGFVVGEIEIIVQHKSQVPEAVDKIQKLAYSLDFRFLDLVSTQRSLLL